MVSAAFLSTVFAARAHFDRARRPPPQSEDIAKEIDILCGLDHPNVVGMKEWFEEGGKVSAEGGARGWWRAC